MPNEPIKSLGVYYSYDQKLLREKTFLEKLDKIKKLINIWSSRGLSLYGEVTIIKSLIIPKFVYLPPLLPTPKDFIQGLNQFLFKLLWKGIDKVTRHILLIGLEVRFGKNCARGLEYGPRTQAEGTVFPYTDWPKPVNNILLFFFFCLRFCLPCEQSLLRSP